MLKLPENLSAETFLQRYWQKQALFMPAALRPLRPAISRHELAWLATLDDVESRLVFTERDGKRCRYRAISGPFDPEYLRGLPRRDWTLLVHDVDKHLPAMRSLISQVPFIPDWRVDDLMVSFAAPGGGAGPHRDHFDVFLCQGIGVRHWRYTNDDIASDPDASDDLALLSEFTGDEESHAAEGDILYLPPGVAHWGTAQRACLTYSIGMRAPQASDFPSLSGQSGRSDAVFYKDADLHISEAVPGYISKRATQRVCQMLCLQEPDGNEVAAELGRFATQPKDWLKAEDINEPDVEKMLDRLHKGGRLRLHGMSQIAFDDRLLHVNGRNTALPDKAAALIADLCCRRSLSHALCKDVELADLFRWMLRRGAFEIPEEFRPYVK